MQSSPANNANQTATKALGVALVLLGAAVILPGMVAGAGGDVGNVLPTVETFTDDTDDATSRPTENHYNVFSGTVKDNNGEAEIIKIKIEETTSACDGGVGFSEVYTVVAADLTQTIADATYSADPVGWKVWNTDGASAPQDQDGVLNFEYKHQWEAGTQCAYTINAFVTDFADASSYEAFATPIVQDVKTRITEGADPFLVASPYSADTGITWGNWAANPTGDATVDAVTSTNWIEIKNTGSTGAQEMTITFDSAFTQTDTDWTIPISAGAADNLDFYAVESATCTVPTGLGTLVQATAPGSLSLTFTAIDYCYYVAYEITDLPGILHDETYSTNYVLSATN